MDHRTVCDDRNLTAVAKYFALANLEQLRFAIDRNTHTVAARITHRSRSSVLDHCERHIAHLAFIFRRHDDDVWHATKVCDIEQAVVSLPVASGDTTAVHAELDVEILNADVVNDLIEAALQEG